MPITLSADVRGSEEVYIWSAKKKITNYRRKDLTFDWQVSTGKIASGQGTAQIILDTTGIAADDVAHVIITVQVKGIPPECSRTVSGSITVDPECIAPTKFDEYDNLPFKSEQAVLDNLALHLMGNRDSVAYILAYAGRHACVDEAKWRADRAKKYLLEKYQIQDERIIKVDGGYRENGSVELFLAAGNTCGPLPTPNVLSNEVRPEGDCSDKGKNRERAYWQ